jgi:AcrR family transcriptional regulator
MTGTGAARTPERQPDTRTLIPDTAERLFAAGGVQGVSVRAILAEAGVNVALAHYHFGGRDGLIRHVLARRIEPLNLRRLQLLEAAAAAAQPRLPGTEAILGAFFAPVVELLQEHPHFARLLAQVHVSPDHQLRAYYGSLFGDVLARFGDALGAVLPAGLDPARRAARTRFVFGVMVHAINTYPRSGVGRDALRGAALLDEMVVFCAAGLHAPPAA